MDKPIIAVDVDDVLVSTAGAIIDSYNKAWGTRLTLKVFYSEQHDSNAWQADEPIATKRVDDYVLSPAFFALSPTQEVITAIQKISERYELHVLTGRPDFVAEPTKVWLQRYFPDIFASANFSNLFVADKRRSKGEMAAEIGAGLLIDDHVKHLVSAAEYGIAGVLFGEYDWNRDVTLPPRVVRCVDWPAVTEYLDGWAA